MIRKSGKKEAGLAVGQVTKILYIMRIWPFPLVLNEWIHEINCALEFNAVGQGILPEVVHRAISSGDNLTDDREYVEVEERIAVWL